MSVLLSGVLMLAFSSLIFWQSRTARKSSTGNEQVTPATPAAIQPVEAPREAELVATAQTQSPPWEVSFAEMDGQPEWLQSQEELEQLADNIPESQLRTALDELLNYEPGASIIVGRRLLRRWADISPDAATDWVAHLSEGAFGEEMSREMAACWSQKDLAAATEWARALPNGENKTAAISSLALEAAKQGQASAISLAASLPRSSERDSLLSYGYQQWAVADLQGAVSGLNQIEDPILHESILAKIAIELGARDPLTAVELIVTDMKDGSLRDEALGNAVRFWAVSAPEKCIAWLEQLPDGRLRTAAIDNVIEVRRKQDPMANFGNRIETDTPRNGDDGGD